MPVSIAIEVMPICTVDRKRVGSAPSVAATRAVPLPRSINGCSRALRALTSAISDIAKKPFSTTRNSSR